MLNAICLFLWAVVAPSQDTAADTMPSFEFEHAQVGNYVNLRGPKPESHLWHYITNVAGDQMMKKQKVVSCCTEVNGVAGVAAKKYIYEDHTETDAGDVIMVKYAHKSGSHAILVRKTTEIDVSIEVGDLHDDTEGYHEFCQILARDDKGECLFARLAPRDSTFRISDLADCVKATLSAKNKATCQSKVNWSFAGIKVGVSKHIIKAKNVR
jgi:hypothetical protein